MISVREKIRFNRPIDGRRHAYVVHALDDLGVRAEYLVLPAVKGDRRWRVFNDRHLSREVATARTLYEAQTAAEVDAYWRPVTRALIEQGDLY